MANITITTGDWQEHNIQGSESNLVKCSIEGVYLVGAVEPSKKEYLVAVSVSKAFTIEYIGYTGGRVTDSGRVSSSVMDYDGRTIYYLVAGPWYSPRPEPQIATCTCEDSTNSAKEKGIKYIMDIVDAMTAADFEEQSNKHNITIKFDTQGSPLPLRMILATKSGKMIRELPINHIKFTDNLGNGSEVSFDVYKERCLDKNNNFDKGFWDKIENLRLAYCPEFDLFYELAVEFTDSSETVKAITATSLGEAELSQINVYGIEINTESDITRDDYEPTVLYDDENKAVSLIDRLLYKAPHYNIAFVDSTIKGIQRTFQFDGKSIYDAFQDVAQEIGCLFRIECRRNDQYKIERNIYVYDLWNTCRDCGERGEFMDTCDNCGSTNIRYGYGKDTTIYVDKDNLADEIVFSTDVASIKNCFRLTAGDDLMTAAIISCNPNGSQYIWYVPEYMQEDMTDELKEKLNEYNALYDYYQKEHEIIVTRIVPEE